MNCFHAFFKNYFCIVLCIFASSLYISACDDDDNNNDIVADDDDDELVQTPAYADVVVDAPGAIGSGLGDSNNAVNGVRGGGMGAGSMDVFSLGLESGVNNYITLRWKGRVVLNGPGNDFAVFENCFAVGSSGESNFMDIVVIYLSRDGENWVAYPHDYINADETVYSANPAMWQGFGGVHPVLYHEENNPVDVLDFEQAGGDHFDLDNLPDEGEAAIIKQEGFVFIKIVAAPTEVNSDTGAVFVKDGMSNGADIDGVYAGYFKEE